MGGGYALKAAAQDPRVAALACVAGAYPGAPGSFAHHGGECREALRDIWDRAWTEDGLAFYQKAVTDDGGPAAMMGAEPFEYYGTDRAYSPHWDNSPTVASGYQTMTIDTLAAADLISPTPLLVVHGVTDEFCSPEGAQAVYDKAGEPKKIVWLPTTNHIDLYDVPGFVNPAVDELTAFFSEHL